MQQHALERCHRLFQFDLRRMIEFGPDYNQAVKDAADHVEEALRRRGKMIFFSKIWKSLLAGCKWVLADPKFHVPDITPEQAAEIKTLYLQGEHTQKELGAMFGVHQSQISRILSGDRH